MTWTHYRGIYPSEVSYDIYNPSGIVIYSVNATTPEGLLDVPSFDEVCLPGTGVATATDNCDSDVTVTYADTTVAGTDVLSDHEFGRTLMIIVTQQHILRQ